MKRTGTHRHIVGLQQDTSLLTPILLESEDQILKYHWLRPGGHVAALYALAGTYSG